MFSAECELISKGCEHGDVFRGTGGRRLWIFHRMQADIHGFRKTRLFITGRGRILHPSFPARGHRASCALLFFAIFRQINHITGKVELFGAAPIDTNGCAYYSRNRGSGRGPRQGKVSRHSGFSAFRCFSISAFRCSGIPAFKRFAVSVLWHSGISVFRYAVMPLLLRAGAQKRRMCRR